MKKIALVSLLFSQGILFSRLASAQLTPAAHHGREIGRASRGHEPFIRLTESITETDTSYLLLFQTNLDMYSSGVQFISFKGTATMNELYSTLTTAIAKNQGELISFMLGNTSIQVSTAKFLGSKSLNLTTPKGTFSLNDQDLRQLFERM